MAQWDVYRNPSTRLRDEIPFLVDLQSDLLSGLAAALPRRMCPTFTVDDVPVVLLPQEASAVDARLLKGRVVSLRSRAHEIVDALDAVVSGV
jgi:toxin CcdB